MAAALFLDGNALSAVARVWETVLAPHRWTLLAVALGGLVFGHLTSRASFFGRKSQDNRLEAEKLYEFTYNTSLLDLHQKPGPQLAALVQSLFDVEAVAIFEPDLNEVYRIGQWFGNAENSVRNFYLFETPKSDR